MKLSRTPVFAHLAALLFVATSAALAANATEADAALRKEMAVCNSGTSPQGRATCVKEAQAAHAENLRGNLDDGDARYRRNARARCDALPGSQRDDCRARMRGEGTTSGSAAAGGVARELVTTSPAASAASAAPVADQPTTPK
jgi:hypothetical protein